MKPAAALFAIVAVLATACVDNARPAACDEPSTTIELALAPGTLTPNDPAACRGQEVTLVIASEVDGVIHIHGYDAHVPATAVSAGDELRLEFPAERSGQFPIELHPADDPRGVSVGILTVHEP